MSNLSGKAKALREIVDVDELERIRPEPKEIIAQFKNKLTKAARELAGAYSQDALLTRFIRNLPPSMESK